MECLQSKPVTTAVFTTPITTSHSAANTCVPSGNNKSKTRLNSNARPFTPRPQCDRSVDSTPTQGCNTTVNDTKSCEYDYSAIRGCEKTLCDKMMSVGSSKKPKSNLYPAKDFGYS